MPECDLAALVIPRCKSSHAPLCLADNLPEKGERVVAFGTPEGLSFSATEGIVSATRTASEVGRSFLASHGVDLVAAVGYDPNSSWIQSSAPISHGNSGGPLVNMRGEVVGVNTLLNANGQNICFAVSSAEIKRLVNLTRQSAIPLGLLAKPTVNPQFKILDSQRDAMMGLTGVVLVVGDLSKEAKTYGMEKNEIRAFVERKLRTTGIKIGTGDELGGPVGVLEVCVDTLALDNGLVLIYVIGCRFDRFVAVNPYARDHVEVALASVWNARAHYGFAGRAVFGSAVREALDRLIDEFADAFLATNGK
jgi:hypothetical protein